MAIEKSLKMDLPALAEMLRAKGRGKDTMLAHITPKEAALLKRRGGSGSVNPDTGLPEFEDSGSYDYSAPAPVSPVYDTISTPAQAPTPVDNSGGGYGLNYGQAPVSTAIPTTDASGQSYNYYPGAEQQSYATPGLSATTQYGIQPALPSLQPSLAQAPFGAIEGTTSGVSAAPTKTDPNAPKDFSEQLKAALTPGNLAKLGLVAGLGAFGSGQARKAGAQNVAATGEQQAIAAPYQQQGQQLIGQAQRGELSPQSQQAYQAAQAQINQGVANRGGVGQQQSANQLANIYNTLLNNQYTYGLQIAQIGDNISLGAIKTGLQLDQTLNQATTNFYTQLASLAAGGGIGGQTVTLRT